MIGLMIGSADSKEHLLDTVEQVIAESGVRSLSLRAVARRAGVSHAAPGHHFGDKEGMLAAFAQRGFGILGRMMTESTTSAGDSPASRFIEDGKTYVRFAMEHRPYFDVMFRSDLDKTGHPNLDEAAVSSFDGLRRGVSEMQAAGVLADADSEMLTLYFWAMAHGLASLWADNQIQTVFGQADPEKMIDAVLSLGVNQSD